MSAAFAALASCFAPGIIFGISTTFAGSSRNHNCSSTCFSARWFPLAPSIAATAAFVVSLGGPSIAGRYIPEFIERRQSKNLVALTVGLVVMRIIGLVIFVTVLYAINGWVADLFNFNEFLRDWILVILLFAGVSQLGQFIGPVLLAAYFEQSKLGIIQAAGSLARLAIVIALIKSSLEKGLVKYFSEPTIRPRARSKILSLLESMITGVDLKV